MQFLGITGNLINLLALDPVHYFMGLIKGENIQSPQDLFLLQKINSFVIVLFCVIKSINVMNKC